MDQIEEKFLTFITHGPGLVLILGLLGDLVAVSIFHQVLLLVTK